MSDVPGSGVHGRDLNANADINGWDDLMRAWHACRPTNGYTRFCKTCLRSESVKRFTPRGLTETLASQGVLDPMENAADALNAFKILVAHSRINAVRLAHIGFNRGVVWRRAFRFSLPFLAKESLAGTADYVSLVSQWTAVRMQDVQNEHEGFWLWTIA